MRKVKVSLKREAPVSSCLWRQRDRARLELWYPLTALSARLPAHLRSHTHPPPRWEPHGDTGMYISVRRESMFRRGLSTGLACFCRDDIPATERLQSPHTYLPAATKTLATLWVPKAGLEGKKDDSNQTSPVPLSFPSNPALGTQRIPSPPSVPSPLLKSPAHTLHSMVTIIHREATFMAFLWMIPLSTW